MNFHVHSVEPLVDVRRFGVDFAYGLLGLVVIVCVDDLLPSDSYSF